MTHCINCRQRISARNIYKYVTNAQDKSSRIISAWLGKKRPNALRERYSNQKRLRYWSGYFNTYSLEISVLLYICTFTRERKWWIHEQSLISKVTNVIPIQTFFLCKLPRYTFLRVYKIEIFRILIFFSVTSMCGCELKLIL